MSIQSTNSAQEVELKEVDFPQKSSRLEEILVEYQKENGISTPTPRTSRSVAIIPEAKERKFDELSDDEKSIVSRIAATTDYLDKKALATYGSAKESVVTKNSNEVIEKYKARDIGEISNPLTELVATMNSNNPRELVSKIVIPEGKRLSFLDIRNIKNVRKRLEKMIAEYDTISNNIMAVETKLKYQQELLLDDIQHYTMMRKGTVQQVVDFELSSIALTLMIEDAEHKLSALLSKSNLSIRESDEADNLNDALDRMQNKKLSIISVQTSAFQTIPQLKALVKTNEILVDKITEVIELLIPLWSWQYAITIGLIRQQEALKILDSVKGVTSQLLTSNAKMMHDNAIAAQEQLYKAAVALEDLEVVQGYISDMIDKISEYSNQAREKGVEDMKRMRQIQAQNIQLLSGTAESELGTNAN